MPRAAPGLRTARLLATARRGRFSVALGGLLFHGAGQIVDT
jgi:hypothetical protein